MYLCIRYTVHHVIISLLVQLRYTHIQCSVVLLYKIPLHVSGWLAHHQEVQKRAVHAATSLLLWYVSVVAVGNGLDQSIPNGHDGNMPE